ncbi:MAG: hypothetical protein A3C90_03025 [Candidatus Magasanikbacteria bacterium RIFCSPHIGHO2_02_FULL_51_14]|uniref:DUF4134 domain-containing protein n=1 Tax=Candidatus Magasanikbacteria bacterium RIFCSPHIGHO2_02_FULL_51_14 TaxID=1798683 RepID=A0A1F6MR73_9BACT|nr:MAG: hypothetical protein A3C90_03025 [Candidatus Magasanikbacteria bacterium RIFCSPHIGHO2_02_FULL_51_14]
MKQLFFFIALFIFALLPAAASAIDLGQGLLEGAAEEAGYNKETTETTFAETIGVIVQAAMAFLGIIFTALIVYAGFLWMTARGDEEKVKKAQGIIRMAIIGLVIVLASYSISFFVLQALLSR